MYMEDRGINDETFDFLDSFKRRLPSTDPMIAPGVSSERFLESPEPTIDEFILKDNLGNVSVKPIIGEIIDVPVFDNDIPTKDTDAPLTDVLSSDNNKTIQKQVEPDIYGNTTRP